jgi:hypothetical protein
MYKTIKNGKNYINKILIAFQKEELMKQNQMKNMVVIKDLPSNIVDEAIIILKNNKKIKSLNTIEKQGTEKPEKEINENYVVKEAEMVISNFISQIEKEKHFKSFSIKQLEFRYKKMKAVTIVLSIIVVINIILNVAGIK